MYQHFAHAGAACIMQGAVIGDPTHTASASAWLHDAMHPRTIDRVRRPPQVLCFQRHPLSACALRRVAPGTSFLAVLHSAGSSGVCKHCLVCSQALHSSGVGLQIVDAVPPHCLPRVLAATGPAATSLEPDGTLEEGHWTAEPIAGPDAHQLARLLQLLPASLHPTIVSSCCRRASGGGAFRIPQMPACCDTCPQHSTAQHSAQRAPDDPGSVEAEGREGAACGPSCASAVFQLLAAAAPLAGGDAERARDPGALEALLSGAATAASASAADAAAVDGATGGSGTAAVGDVVADNDDGGGPLSKRLCVRQPARGRAARGAATRAPAVPANTAVVSQLTLTVSSPGPVCLGLRSIHHDFPTPELPRWCAALAQLRTLRHLSVTAADSTHLSPAALGPALLALPALEALEVRCEAGLEFDDAVNADPAAGELLATIGSLTQLSALALVNYFCSLGNLVGDGFEPLPQVSALSKLTRLTSLAAKWVTSSGSDADAFVRVIKQMTALRVLEIDMYDWEGVSNCAELVLQSVTETKLTALQSLAIRSGLEAPLLRVAIAAHNPALLSRITALSLPRADIVAMQEDDLRAEHVHSVMALLARTPALQALDVGHNALRDAGLKRLAALLPRLPHLSHLSLRHNGATPVGVTAVLEASGNLQAAAGVAAGGLRELDVSGNAASYASSDLEAEIGALARQLRRQHRLEALNITNMHLPEGGWRRVASALEALPALRRLRVRQGWPTDSLQGLFDGLRHVCID